VLLLFISQKYLVGSLDFDIYFVIISFKCLIWLELECYLRQGYKDFNSELTNSIAIGIVVLAATSSELRLMCRQCVTLKRRRFCAAMLFVM